MRKLFAGMVVVFAGCATLRPGPAADVNNAPPGAIAQVAGLSETTAEQLVAGRPYWKKHQLVERNILTESEYRQVEARLYVGPPAIPEYMHPVPPVTW